MVSRNMAESRVLMRPKGGNKGMAEGIVERGYVKSRHLHSEIWLSPGHQLPVDRG